MKLFGLAILFLILHCCTGGTEGRNVNISLREEEGKGARKYYWFPKDDGSNTAIPAYFENSPETKAYESDIHFFLFTRDNPSTSQELFINNIEALQESNYDFEAPVKIIAHGFGTASYLIGSSGTIKNAYASTLGKANLNLILIDWSKLSASPWYGTAASNTRLVGNKITRLIEFLVANQATTLSQIHLIGHSLGSHVCGFAGSSLSIGKVSRITALDPAFPLFGFVNDQYRIDPSDAHFVDVIHTSGGKVLEGGLSFIEPRGHADFYVNGGRKQPGCTGSLVAAMVCSHESSYIYFSESILYSETTSFPGCKCSTWEDFNNCTCKNGDSVDMGEFTPLSTRGYFYVTTNSESPYGQICDEDTKF